MKWMCVLFCLLLTVAVTTPVAQAQVTDPRLSNSEEPGSVLVFPIFRKGSQTTTDLGTVPNTAFEISLVCPPGGVPHDGGTPTPFTPTPFVCNHTTVYTVHAEWVCAGTGTFPFKVCNESDFTFPITVDGTVRFDPGNLTPIVPGVVTVSPPPCNQGYLLAWVTDGSDRPVKFDGLIGDAVLRESPSAATAYNAIPIQADPFLPTTDPPTLIATDATGRLEFDGGTGRYQMVTGKIYGSVRYTNPSVSATSAVTTSLVLLTLDVDSGRINLPTFVDLNFFSELQAQVSKHTQFTCWERDGSVVPIPSQIFGATKGVVASNTASDGLFPRNLLGLIITQEKNPNSTPKGAISREYAYPFYNDSVPVDTDFLSHPGGAAKQ